MPATQSRKEEDLQEYRQSLEGLKASYHGINLELTTAKNLSIPAVRFDAAKYMPTQEAQSSVKSRNPHPSLQGATVVLCVGNDRSVFERRDSALYENMIKAYLERGINVVCFDYPGVGLSQGSFSEENSYAAVQAIINYLTGEGVPKNKMLLEGYSMGSGPATQVAAQNEGVNLLLHCPFLKPSAVGDAILQEQNVPKFSRNVAQRLVDYTLHYDNLAKINQVAGNIGIISMSQDANLHESTLHHAQKLHEATNSRAWLKEIQGSDHFAHYQESSMGEALDEYLMQIGFTVGKNFSSQIV